jgi:O-antigen/teichoic acid export membrane protein
LSRSAVILRNAACNWAGFAVSAAVTLVLTPFVVHALGEARYGIWILSSSIIGYYGLLDLGFRAGVTQYVTRYLAAGDLERASDCMSTAVVAFAGLGLVLAGLSVVAAAFAPGLFDLPAALTDEIFWCILIVGLTSAASCVFFPAVAVFTATQRFDLANAITIASRLLTAGLVFAALEAGGGLIGISAATCIATLADYASRWLVARRLAPGLRVERRRARLSRLREIGSFGGWNFLISINAFAYNHLSNLLIAWLLPVAAVGQYALAMGLVRQINSGLGPVAWVFYPAAAELHVRGDQGGLERLYHDGSRLVLLTMVTTVMGAALWAEDFYRLWIGETYLSASPFGSVALIFQILLVGTATTFAFQIAVQILTAAGHIRPLALALIVGSAINVSLSIMLIGPLGLVGVAAATVVASLIIDVVVMPVLAHRCLGLSPARFLRLACPRPLAVAVLLAAWLAGLRLGLGPAATWTALLLQGVLAGGGAALLILAVGITGDERRRLLLQPARRLKQRLLPAGARAS